MKLDLGKFKLDAVLKLLYASTGSSVFSFCATTTLCTKLERSHVT